MFYVCILLTYVTTSVNALHSMAIVCVSLAPASIHLLCNGQEDQHFLLEMSSRARCFIYVSNNTMYVLMFICLHCSLHKHNIRRLLCEASSSSVGTWTCTGIDVCLFSMHIVAALLFIVSMCLIYYSQYCLLLLYTLNNCC